MSTTISVALLNTTTTTTHPYSWNGLRATERRYSTFRLLKKRPARTSCEQKDDPNEGAGPPTRIDRRNVLLGLGGLYGFAGSAYKTARGEPVPTVDLTQCQDAHADVYPGKDLKCCPPYSCLKDGNQCTIKDFKFPSRSVPLRKRKPAHLLSGSDLEKFEKAIRLMKALPDDDPWSFNNQAKIHCAYCDGAYDQVGFDAKVDVHGNWFFAPWHRFYIYFYERILGKLIGDDSFTLPFWNWDNPEGMPMPEIFTKSSSSLYDEFRNQDHLAYPAILDLNYSKGPPQTPVPKTPKEVEKVVKNNLCKIHNIYNENICHPESFMGAKVSASDSSSRDGAGQLERLHNYGHFWVGLPDTPFRDMGDFSTAGYDILFYCHHVNVDRLWSIYSKFRRNKVEFRHRDWLDASFIFYDENRDLVRVKVSDALNTFKLRYTYDEVPLKWCSTVTRRSCKNRHREAQEVVVKGTRSPVSEFGTNPRALEKTIRATIPRPKKSGEGSQLEVLVIDGIDEPNTDHVMFDIYIAIPAEDGVGSELGALVGSFTKLPHGRHRGAQRVKSIFKTGITFLLDDIEAGDADKLVVSLVPRDGGDVSVGSIGIELVEKEIDCPRVPCR